MSHLKKKEKKRKKRRDIGLGDASGEEPPRPSEGGAWNKSSGSLAVPGPQPPPTNKKQRTSAAVLSSHKTKSIAATVYCERCGSTTREDLRECSECQSSYCGACSELPPVQNPCLRVGLAHSFSDQPMSLAYSFSSFAEEIEAGSAFGSSSLFQGGSRGGGISLADSGGSRPSFSRTKPGELYMGSSSPQDILWKSSKRTMSDEDPHLLSSQSFNSPVLLRPVVRHPSEESDDSEEYLSEMDERRYSARSTMLLDTSLGEDGSTDENFYSYVFLLLGDEKSVLERTVARYTGYEADKAPIQFSEKHNEKTVEMQGEQVHLSFETSVFQQHSEEEVENVNAVILLFNASDPNTTHTLKKFSTPSICNYLPTVVVGYIEKDSNPKVVDKLKTYSQKKLSCPFFLMNSDVSNLVNPFQHLTKRCLGGSVFDDEPQIDLKKSYEESLKKNSAKGSIKDIRKLLGATSQDVNFLALCNACKFGHTAFVEAMLSNGVNPIYVPEISDEQPKGLSEIAASIAIEPALHVAIRSKQPKCVRVLLRWSKTSLLAKNKNGENPVMVAVEVGLPPMVISLLKREHYRDEKVRQHMYMSACSHAVKLGQRNILYELFKLSKGDLSLKLDVQKIFKWWVYASSKTFVKVVELLLFLCSKRFGKPYEDVFTEEVVKELGPINITRSQLKINSPVITSAVAELIPWKYLKDRIKEVDLRHCSLTKVPFGFGDLDDGKIKKIRLDGNPLTGFSRSFLGCSGPDIVRGIRQVRKDNKAKWNEVRLLVIGDAAVGKTTLIEALNSKNSKFGDQPDKLMSTDGIVMGSIELEGINFLCLDFAGQEVYRYTHQLFLTTIGLFLVVFDISKPESVSWKQICFWMESVAHRVPMGKLLLVGTHLSQVSEKVGSQRIERIAGQLSERYGTLCAGKVMVDSLDGEGIPYLKDTVLPHLARSLLVTVPLSFYDAFDELQSIKQSVKGGAPIIPLHQYTDKLGSIIEEEKERKTVLRLMSLLGYIIYVESEKYAEDKKENANFLVLDPSWLAEVFATVVTVRHAYVKNGLVSEDGLAHIWSSYPEKLRSAIRQMLEQFGIIHQLRDSSRVIVPCLLPNEEPAITSLFDKFEVARSPSVWRSYLLRESSFLPVGVMGMLLASLFKMGEILQAWGTGCCVKLWKKEKNGKKSAHTIVLRLWSEWWGRRLGLHFAVFSPVFSSEATSVVRNLHNILSNLLIESYHIPHTVVVGVGEERLETFDMDQIIGAIRTHQMTVVGKWSGKEYFVDSLAPDLLMKDLDVMFIHKEELKLEKVIGIGGFGEVRAAQYTPAPTLEPKSKRKSEKTKSKPKDGTITVAVKILHGLSGTSESHGVKLLKEINREVYQLSALRHPNVIELKGLCVDDVVPWIVMEMVSGGDLDVQLLDPTNLKKSLDDYAEVFNAGYLKKDPHVLNLLKKMKKKPDEIDIQELSSFGIEKEVGCAVSVGNCLNQIRDAMNHPSLIEMYPSLISANFEHMELRSEDSSKLIQTCTEEILEKYHSLYETIAPLRWDITLRIAADVAAGMNFLHTLDPPMLHRDLKTPNVFMTRKLVGTIPQEVVESENLAKIGDFGLSAYMMGTTQFRQLESEEEEEETQPIAPRWAAPELISGSFYSLKSDVYSMGLLLWEIKYRKMVYHEVRGMFANEEIKQKVLKGERPHLRDNDSYDQLIEKCWAPAADRPSFSEIYEEIRMIAKKDSPNLFKSLPPLRKRQRQKARINCNFFCHLKVPPIQIGETLKKNRIICAAPGKDHLWFGCSSGVIGCFDISLNVLEPVVTLDFQYQPNVMVNDLVFDKSDNTIWTASDNGLLKVWEGTPVAGSVVLDQLATSSLDVQVEKGKETFPSCKLSLSAGCIAWAVKSGKTSFVSVEEILDDFQVDPKSMSLTLTPKEGDPLCCKFLEMTQVAKWDEILRCCKTCKASKSMLLQVGETLVCDPQTGDKVSLLSLKKIDGSIWSLDRTLRVTRWDLEEDITGIKKNRMSVVPRQSWPINTSSTPPMFGCMLSVGAEEMWVSCGEEFAMIHRSSFLDSQGGGGDLRQSQLTIRVGKHNNAIRDAVYIRTEQQKEVWVGGEEGIIVLHAEDHNVLWRYPEIDVTAMVTFLDEVWVGTNDGGMKRFDISTKTEIGRLDKSHERTISCISSTTEDGKMRIWVSSLDSQVSVWK